MKASADETRKAGPDQGWDETVLVWNATVARIPAPANAAGRREAGPPLSEPSAASRPPGRRARRPSSAAPGRA
jgi:hypothetical protein